MANIYELKDQIKSKPASSTTKNMLSALMTAKS